MINKTLLNMLGNKKKLVALDVGISVIALIASVGITALFCLLLAHALGAVSINSVYCYCGIALCIVVKCTTILASGALRRNLGSNVKLNLRNQAYSKLLSNGITHNKGNNAWLTQMIIEGVEHIDTYYTAYLPSFFYAMIAPILLFIMCLFLQWQVGLALIICLPLIPISIVMVSKYAKKVFAKYWGKYVSMGNGFLDTIEGMKEIKIFGAEQDKGIQLNDHAEQFRKITMKVLVMQLCSLTIIDLVAFTGAGIAIVLAVNNGTIANTAVVPFVSLFLVLISAEFFLPMIRLASAFHVAMNGATAGCNIYDYIHQPTLEWGDATLDSVESIALDDVTFSYDDSRNILDNVNMQFGIGSTAIVGQSGSGKSTAVALLLGSILPCSGTVSVNGNSITGYQRDSYYSNIGYVSHDTFIFNASIRHNFMLAKSDITQQEMHNALAKVNLLDFVQQMGGLDYIVKEDSENISGGQRQRLAIAINTVQHKSIYIFDEATSNIDIDSEAIIMRNIALLAHNSIVIIISHRLANVVQCNNIYMLEEGNITQCGTHSQLMATNGSYSQLYNAQYQQENHYKEAVHAYKK